MKDILRQEINDTIRRETWLTFEEYYISGKVYLVGFPMKSHPRHGNVACFIWTEKEDGCLSFFTEYKNIPDFFLQKEITLEEIEEAIKIMEEIEHDRCI